MTSHNIRARKTTHGTNLTKKRKEMEEKCMTLIMLEENSPKLVKLTTSLVITNYHLIDDHVISCHYLSFSLTCFELILIFQQVSEHSAKPSLPKLTLIIPQGQMFIWLATNGCRLEILVWQATSTWHRAKWDFNVSNWAKFGPMTSVKKGCHWLKLLDLSSCEFFCKKAKHLNCTDGLS